MNELKLTEIAPYLPYGVECIVDPNYAQIRTKIWRLDAQEGDANIFSFFSKGGFYYRTLKSVKPILRPLSDLTREIEHNRERFVPICEIFDEITTAEYGDRIPFDGWNVEDDYIEMVSYDSSDNEHRLIIRKNQTVEYWINLKPVTINVYQIIQKLLSWHFDVFSLIPRDLAVDYNTVNQNV